MSREAKVLELPLCNICEKHPAEYDSRFFGRTTWAFMCEKCYETFGVSLGTGNAQKLILIREEK